MTTRTRTFCGGFLAVAIITLVSTLPLSAGTTGGGNFALAIGPFDKLVVFDGAGEKVGEYNVGSVGQVVEVGKSPFKLSYGRDLHGRFSVIVSPHDENPVPLHFTVLNNSITVSESAIATITFANDLRRIGVDPGFVGAVTVNGRRITRPSGMPGTMIARGPGLEVRPRDKSSHPVPGEGYPGYTRIGHPYTAADAYDLVNPYFPERAASSTVYTVADGEDVPGDYAELQDVAAGEAIANNVPRGPSSPYRDVEDPERQNVREFRDSQIPSVIRHGYYNDQVAATGWGSPLSTRAVAGYPPLIGGTGLALVQNWGSVPGVTGVDVFSVTNEKVQGTDGRGYIYPRLGPSGSRGVPALESEVRARAESGPIVPMNEYYRDGNLARVLDRGYSDSRESQAFLQHAAYWAESITPPDRSRLPKIGPSEIMLLETQGNVTIIEPGKGATGAGNGMMVNSGVVIETDDESSVALFLGGVNSVRVAGDSRATVFQRLEGKSRVTEVRLDKGLVFSKVNERVGGQSFKVVTPAGVAAAKGTDYATRYRDGKMVALSVSGGVDVFDASGNLIGTAQPTSRGDVSMVATKPTDDLDFRIILGKVLSQANRFNTKINLILSKLKHRSPLTANERDFLDRAGRVFFAVRTRRGFHPNHESYRHYSPIGDPNSLVESFQSLKDDPLLGPGQIILEPGDLTPF